jgi:hypothetical protein
LWPHDGNPVGQVWVLTGFVVEVFDIEGGYPQGHGASFLS